jgi:hypothetical protein
LCCHRLRYSGSGEIDPRIPKRDVGAVGFCALV